MKEGLGFLLSMIGLLTFAGAALAIPMSIIDVIYQYGAKDLSFGKALWSGAQLWLTAWGLAIFIGFPCYFTAQKILE